MREFTPDILLALSQHLLGWLFWPVCAFAVLCLLNLIWLIASDGRIARGEFLFSIVAGVAGGIAAVGFMLALTRSTLSDMTGFVDWVLLAGIWLAGMFGTTATVYAIARPVRLAARPGTSRPGAAPSYMAPSQQPLRVFLAAVLLTAAGAFAYQTFTPGPQGGHLLAAKTGLPRAAQVPAWLGRPDPEREQHGINGRAAR
jgi:hypothetical protein